jgi:hypothetical protein
VVFVQNTSVMDVLQFAVTVCSDRRSPFWSVNGLRSAAGRHARGC